MMFLINRVGLYQCIDIDIKGFFDNVSHGKLLRQLWSLGIRDKKLLKIVSLILKSETQGEGVPTKGTPQGGILSPLLSNVVLNELDWWISNQWETFNTKRKYKGNKYTALKKTNLKECFIVRYADDFKILCRTRSQANKMYHAIKQFLRDRLDLDINEEKSKIVNLKRKNSEFLGFSIKAKSKGSAQFGYVAQSHMTDKAIKNATMKIRDCIVKIQKNPCRESVHNFNSTVIGIQNYYCRATNITKNLAGISYSLQKVLYNRLNEHRTQAIASDMSPSMKERYKGYQPKLYKIQDMVFVPIHAQKHKKCMNFTQTICNYTVKGRAKIHGNLAVNSDLLGHIMRSYIPYRSIEYNDYRISRFVAQYGKCAISKVELSYDDWHCHHIIPVKYGGSDHYSNLMILHKEIHKLIHLVDQAKIKQVIHSLKLSKEQIKKVNDLRIKAHMETVAV